MYCQASPSLGTNSCRIASVAGSAPSRWYSRAPATRRVCAEARPLGQVAAELEVGVHAVLDPAEELEDRATGRRRPTCCSARRGRSRARAARRRRGVAQRRPGAARQAPAIVPRNLRRRRTASSSARPTSGSVSASARTARSPRRSRRATMLRGRRPPCARRARPRAAQRHGVALGLALDEVDPDDQHPGRQRGPLARERQGSTTETDRMRRALPPNQRRVGRKRAIARSSSPRRATGQIASIGPGAAIAGAPSSATATASSRGPSMASQ